MVARNMSDGTAATQLNRGNSMINPIESQQQLPNEERQSWTWETQQQQQQQQQVSPFWRAIQRFAAASVGATIAEMSTLPVDIGKVRLQLQKPLADGSLKCVDNNSSTRRRRERESSEAQ